MIIFSKGNPIWESQFNNDQSIMMKMYPQWNLLLRLLTLKIKKKKKWVWEMTWN